MAEPNFIVIGCINLNRAAKTFCFHILSSCVRFKPNARLTEQIFDGGFFACFCKKGDSENLSGAAVCYAISQFDIAVSSSRFTLSLKSLTRSDVANGGTERFKIASISALRKDVDPRPL